MKQHTKAPHTAEGTQVTIADLEEMAFEEHQLIEVDNAAGLYRYTDNGGVHYVAPMRPVFVAPPRPGDDISASWDAGCGAFSLEHFLLCSYHVGDYHVAAGISAVLKVWAR